jgi:hypothetical protein
MKPEFSGMVLAITATLSIPTFAASGAADSSWAAFDKLAASGQKLPRGKMHLLENKLVFALGRSHVDADGAPDATKIDPQGQSCTSMTINGKPVNARKIPFYVLPLYHYKKLGIDLGDFAAVRCKRTHRLYGAIFADQGPPNEFGETSMYMNSKLGFSDSPIDGGTEDLEVEYLIFPGSRDKSVKTDDSIQKRVQELLQKRSKS